MPYARFHWRLFNVLARILGIGFLLFGCIGLLQATFGSLPAGGDAPIVIFVCVLVAVVGVLMIRVKPYRPDLDGYASTFRISQSGTRTWWTGEPK
jgi:hypothetical protein